MKRQHKDHIFQLVLFSILLFTTVFFLHGCAQNEQVLKEDTETTTTTTEAPKVEASAAPILSWEDPKAPHRKEWSKFLNEKLGGEYFERFSKASDNKRLCGKFDTLTKAQKVQVWSEFLVWIMYYESGWKPTSWMVETGMGIDPITKKQVKSEGLLQLSYQDTQWAKFCKFDWSKDKLLKQDDPKKTIFDPYLNMDCGMGIMARQIDKKGKFILSSGVYWSVIKDGGKYSKVEKILAKTKNLPFCK